MGGGGEGNLYSKYTVLGQIQHKDKLVLLQVAKWT